MPTPPVQVKQGVPARQDPWQSFRTEMDRLFDRFGAGFGLPSFRRLFDTDTAFPQALPAMPSFTMAAPAVEVSEDEDGYKIAAELPGMTEKDVEVTIAGGMLTLKGEKRQEAEKTNKNYYVSERSYGAFRRSFALPDGVDTDKVAASFSNGVLTVTLPKTKAAREAEKKIEVKSAS
jgi:HSP20 family protein